MTPPEKIKSDLVRQWLAKANEDLAAAQVLISCDMPLLSITGFHAQQAAEKFLKAFLAYHQLEIPKTHNLGELLDRISKIDSTLAQSLAEVTGLNPYSVEFRYPADFPELTVEDARIALSLAVKVHDAILKVLE